MMSSELGSVWRALRLLAGPGDRDRSRRCSRAMLRSISRSVVCRLADDSVRDMGAGDVAPLG